MLLVQVYVNTVLPLICGVPFVYFLSFVGFDKFVKKTNPGEFDLWWLLDHTGEFGMHYGISDSVSLGCITELVIISLIVCKDTSALV